VEQDERTFRLAGGGPLTRTQRHAWIMTTAVQSRRR
jgi:hypothetical protein